MKAIINGKSFEIADGTTYYDIATSFQKNYKEDILLVRKDDKIVELFKPIEDNSNISFIFFNEKAGYQAYSRSAIFILLKALYEYFPPKTVHSFSLEFRIGDGYYFTIRDSGGLRVINEDDVAKISKIFSSIVSKKIPIKKMSYSTDEASNIFKSYAMTQKSNLLKYRLKDRINIYDIDGFPGYFYGYLLHDTGYIKHYDIKCYKDGILLVLPNQMHPGFIEKEKKLDNLFNAQITSVDWTRSLNANCVAELNEKIATGEFDDLVLLQEAYQEKQIGDIAQKIASSGTRVILIAGPSSSGKTTFSHRLSTHLKALGHNTVATSIDNFFVNRVDTKRDENGEYEYESVENVDRNLFTQTINDLIDGKPTVIPFYDFYKGEKIFDRPPTSIGSNDILVVEGIHCLNEIVSKDFKTKDKFKIYISDLTPISIDEHNRISTSDCRLIRRIVRDNRTRGYNVAETLKMWKKVRKGEEENIFPFQENAQFTFNSALIYELAVLKIYAEPLLFNVSKDDPCYEEARGLLKFLSYFLAAPSDSIPKNSILREFIGGGIFGVV